MLIHIDGLPQFIEELPNDPLLALRVFELRIRDETIDRERTEDAHKSYLTYMNSFVVNHNFDIPTTKKFSSSSFEELAYLSEAMQENVQRLFIEKEISEALKSKGGLTTRLILDGNLKREIRQYAELIKQNLEEADITQSKRDELLGKLNDFISALDQGRSSEEAFADAYFAFKHEARDNVEWGLKNYRLFEKITGKLAKHFPSLKGPKTAGELPAPQEKLPEPQKKLPAPDHEVEEDDAAD